MKFYIEKTGKSAGARRLQRKLQEMGHLCHVGNEQPYRMRKRTLIEWGGNQIDKLRFLTLTSDAMVSTPEFWESKDHAQEWLDEKAKRRMMVRHLLNSSGGKGCEVVESGNPLPDAPLYVEYVPKDAEYRVHLFDCGERGVTKYVQKKMMKRGTEVNKQIRNLANGYIYGTKDVISPMEVLNEAAKAFEATNLDFGAVDVIWNKKREKAYVLEINTAPGLEGKTVDVYANYFASQRS